MIFFSVVPAGLCLFYGPNPAINRWAMILLPSGLKSLRAPVILRNFFYFAGASFTQRKPVCDKPVSGEHFIRALGR
jgi:hypothetical protein